MEGGGTPLPLDLELEDAAGAAAGGAAGVCAPSALSFSVTELLMASTSELNWSCVMPAGGVAGEVAGVWAGVWALAVPSTRTSANVAAPMARMKAGIALSLTDTLARVRQGRSTPALSSSYDKIVSAITN
jgi:hypothetical protein